MGHGADYAYAHEFAEAVSGQDYLEKPLRLYRANRVGAEAAVAERLERWRALKAQRRADPSA
jgi:putative ATPase